MKCPYNHHAVPSQSLYRAILVTIQCHHTHHERALSVTIQCHYTHHEQALLVTIQCHYTHHEQALLVTIQCHYTHHELALLGKPSRKKICLYSDIVQIALWVWGRALAPRGISITSTQLQRCRATPSDPTKCKEKAIEYFQNSLDQYQSVHHWPLST